ncbi:MAG TPA: hypothetical protein VFV62_08180, partial [Gaiellaceae bacterium]|nr:hypothetical protein [Gaiellaceae bacterium]
LDADGAELLDRSLRELAGSATVLLTTHDPARVDSLATARLALAGVGSTEPAMSGGADFVGAGAG